MSYDGLVVSLVLAAAVLLAAHPAAHASDPVPVDMSMHLKAGEATDLLDIGLYRVGYKLGGGKEQWMPDGWTGIMESVNGISFGMYGSQDAKDALFVHSPWRKGGGTTFADYRLEWPESNGLTLEFSSAIKAEFATKSDGVSYRVYVDGKRVLEHLEKGAAWTPHVVDVSGSSREKGKATVRVEVQPGPKGDASFDYSLFGNPRFLVSGSTQSAPTGRHARSTRAPSSDFVNRRDRGTRPSSDLSGATSVSSVAEEIVLSFRGPQAEGPMGISSIDYLVNPGQAFLSGIRAVVNGKTTIPLFSGGSISAPCTLEGMELVGGSAVLKYRVASGQVVATLTPVGKTLVVDVESAPGPSRITFGTLGLVPLRRDVTVPYMDSCRILALPDSGLFCAMGMDWSISNATQLDGLEAVYQPKTDKTTNAVRERAYITISDRLEEVLPNIPHAQSPYLQDLGGRLVIDSWGNSFTENAQYLRELRSYGVSRPAFILHSWQRSGYDNALPNHVPADVSKDGDEGILELVRVAKSMGARIALHENYIDMYTNSDYYSDAAIALDSEGKKQMAWFNEGTGEQSFAMKGNSALTYARQESPAVHSLYGTNADFLDVNSSTQPWFHVDMQASEPLAGTMESIRQSNAELFALERKTHEGPLLGEGHYQQYWAGLVDGVEAQIEGGEDAIVMPEFDLLKLHPQMVNHGMGYMERWLREGYSSPEWPGGVGPDGALDKYRATTLAYGHAGFITSRAMADVPSVLKDYYLLSCIQGLYGAVPVADILHETSSGELLTVSDALLEGSLTGRVLLAYQSGLKVWVNRSEGPWAPSSLTDGNSPVTMPAYGFYAQGPGVRAATVVLDGQTCDYSLQAGIGYADSRGDRAVDLGWIRVAGAVIVRTDKAGIRLIPVPRGQETRVVLRLSQAAEALAAPQIAAPNFTVRDVVARDADGKVLRAVKAAYDKVRGEVTVTVGGAGQEDAFDWLVRPAVR